MNLTILTPIKKLVDNEVVDELFVPGSAGQLDVLPGHANIVSELETGLIRWRTGTQWKTASISYGWLDITDQTISVLADVAEPSTEIDIERARLAAEVARKKLEDGGLDDAHFKKYELKLKRALSRQDAKNF